MECLRLGQAVLTGRGIEHEQDLRLRAGQPLVHDPADLGQLVHQVGAGVEATGRVGDHQVGMTGDGGIKGVVDHGTRIGSGGVRHDGDA